MNFIRYAVKTGDEGGPKIGVLPVQLDKEAGQNKSEKPILAQVNQFIAPCKPQGGKRGAFDGGKAENQKGIAEGGEPEGKLGFHRGEYKGVLLKGIKRWAQYIDIVECTPEAGHKKLEWFGKISVF
jgi:hypothetical protein